MRRLDGVYMFTDWHVGSSEHCLTMETYTDSGGYGAPTGATLAQLTSDQKYDNFGPFAAPYFNDDSKPLT